ncbi:hypothetical protein V8G54_008441 [Vigna mungo]|uniref:Uncharacterized protein n=1 Tax=Vigna mungo TaxID=3915 RepID=A0AAQ3P3I5_VIGMU
MQFRFFIPSAKVSRSSLVKMSMNPFCKIALEEALHIRESALAFEFVVVSIGPLRFTSSLSHWKRGHWNRGFKEHVRNVNPVIHGKCVNTHKYGEAQPTLVDPSSSVGSFICASSAAFSASSPLISLRLSSGQYPATSGQHPQNL